MDNRFIRAGACAFLFGGMLVACAEDPQNGPSDREVEAAARASFLGQTYSNHFGGAHPQDCSSHFEVLDVHVLDRQVGEAFGSTFAQVAVSLRVRATTAFDQTYSCSWGATTSTGLIGHWSAGEIRDLRKQLTFARWESGWRLSE
jgi:hypothetical protein